MRVFYAPKDNKGYGMAIAADGGYVVLGIRPKEGQGEILSFTNRADLDQFIDYLRAAQDTAWPQTLE